MPKASINFSTQALYDPRILAEALSEALRPHGLAAMIREVRAESTMMDGVRFRADLELFPYAYPAKQMPTRQEPATMRDANLFAAINPNVQAVEVVFVDRSVNRQVSEIRAYTYKAARSLGLAVDDNVLVNTGTDEAPQFKVVQVVAVHADASNLQECDYKWIIQKVDLSTYHECVTKEQLFRDGVLKLEREQKRETIKAALRERLGADAAKQLSSETGIDLDPQVIQKPGA